MIRFLLRNPYVAMLSTCWQYAGQWRPKFLLVYGLFIISNLADAALPILWGWFINELQQDSAAALQNTWKYVGIYMGLH
jgi:hypothetical protein